MRIENIRLTCISASFLPTAVCSAQTNIDSAALQRDGAMVTAESGQVSTVRKGQDWAITAREYLWVRQPVVTGEDGYARFQVAGGSSFEVLAHTHLLFRKNPGNPQDLLDIETGRVRVQLGLSAAQPLTTRILTPTAILLCRGAAAFAIAVDDEDNSTRIDVQQGEIEVRHALHPGSDSVFVKAGDAIAVHAGEPLISRRLDRGSLYHYTFQSIWKALQSIVPGRPDKTGDVEEQVTQLNFSREMPVHRVD